MEDKYFIDKNENYYENPNTEIPLKDKFFMSDLEKYYKYGKFPYIMITQIFLLILTTTIIVLSLDDLRMFKYNIRTIDSAFIINKFVGKPSLKSDSFYIIGTIKELNDQINFVLEKIFMFEDNFSHNLKLLELEKLKLEVQYFMYDKPIEPDFSIKSKFDNPLTKMGNSTQEIRKFLLHVTKLTIPLQYEMDIYIKNRNLKLIWELYLIFDFSLRGNIKFTTAHLFSYYREKHWFGAILSNLISIYGIINLSTIIFALIQIFTIIRRIFDGAKALSYLKKSLSNKVYIEDTESILDDSLQKGKTKWEMLKLNEKRKFFNLWFIILFIGNFFQIISSFAHLIFPVMNETNQLLIGLSVLFTWISCGYFLEHEDRYYFFYLTIKKSLKGISKYLLVFLIVFIGYSLLVVNTFYYSEKYYLNANSAFISNFAFTQGDNVLSLWNSTLNRSPFLTFIFTFFFFLVFVAFLHSILLSITDESYDCIKMQKKFNWLEKKLSLEDYLQYEINKIRQNEDDLHYMMCNAIIDVLISINKSNTNIPFHLQQLFDKDIEFLKSEGLEQEDISILIKKKIKSIFKKTRHSHVDDEIKNNLDSDDVFYMNIYHNKSKNIQNVIDSLNSLFNQIEIIFIRIDILVFLKIDKNIKERENSEMIKIYDKMINFTNSFFNRIDILKRKLLN